LWESLLVYGIVLGVADRVLRAAHLHAPPDLVDRSNLYWIGGGNLGGGLTALHLASLSSAIGHAVAAGSPSSGGGGFGGGGGGGGAW
jgi:uncharacterized membrane protein